MPKRLKVSICQLDDLPDEVLLEILSYLDIKDLLRCSQVCRRIRSISHDESLWQKINLFEQKNVTANFIKIQGVQTLSVKSNLLILPIQSWSIYDSLGSN